MFQLGDRNKAHEYASKRRAIRPALYNGRRLKERPRPVVMSNSARAASNPSSQGVPQSNVQNQATQHCVASSSTNMVHQQSQQLNAIATTTTNASARGSNQTNTAVQINVMSSTAGSSNQQALQVNADAQIVNSRTSAAATNTSTNESTNQNSSIGQIDVNSSAAITSNHQLNLTSQSVTSTTSNDDNHYNYNVQSNHMYELDDSENIMPSSDAHNSTAQFDCASTSSSSSTLAFMQPQMNQSTPLHNITNVMSTTLPNVPPSVIAAGLQFIQNYVMNGLMTNSMANSVNFTLSF